MSDVIRLIPDLKEQILNVVSILSEQQNWGLGFIDAQDGWKYTHGEGVTVAVIDTGWYPHKDLIGNFLKGYDGTGNNNILDNGNWHNTHVCGIIAANCGDNIGVTGVAPQSKLITIKSMDESGCGSYDFIINSLKIARDLDVDIINMSIGTPLEPPDNTLHSIIKDIASQGKIIVCAAGNSGGVVNYPAKYDEVIAVAAVAPDGSLAKFSSRDESVDVASPGVNIYSTWGNNQYINLDGTSMSCPCISGMLALIISWHKLHLDMNFGINYKNILKLLYDMAGVNGHLVQANQYNISVPRFCNYKFEE